jgi:hypothetical protein
MAGFEVTTYGRIWVTREAYVPSVDLTVPIVVVQLDIDSFGDEKSVSFGLTETGLKEFVNHLQLTQKEMLAVKKRFGLD